MQRIAAKDSWGGWGQLVEVTQEVVAPVLVALLGVGFSVAALWVALRQLLGDGEGEGRPSALQVQQRLA